MVKPYLCTCGETDPANFYPKRKGTCKQCASAHVQANRLANIEYYQEYDRRRDGDPKRKAAREAYQREKLTPEQRAKYSARHHSKYPEHRAARIAVGNAVRDGRLAKPSACEECNVVGTVTAHHEDYSKPLTVEWLCVTCHGRRQRGINVVRRAG